MAESLVPALPLALRALAGAFALYALHHAALAASATAAAPFSDPTVPPPGYGQRPDGAKAAGGRDAGAAPIGRVQMILVQGDHRSAVIGGRTVGVGDTVEIESGSARVERIDENAMVVRQGQTRLRLPLIEDTHAVRRAADCPTAGARSSACKAP